MVFPEWTVIEADAALSAVLARAIGDTLAGRPPGASSWTLALPGGSVVDRFVGPLARVPLPWPQAHVLFVDERAVPPDDERSNWRVCREVALGTPMAGATWHRLPADEDDLEGAADGYARTLRSLAGTAPQLDVVLLGVGEDGHVASLFPGHATLDVLDAVVIVERDAPKSPAVRLSMSLDVLASARLTCVAAFGASKHGAVVDALDPSSQRPAARLLRRARSPLLLLDYEAAWGARRAPSAE
jgi:6-phosphogluconolactonase